MARPPALGLVIMMLLGISGCAGAPQRFSWSSPSRTSEDRTDSPVTARYSWWHRAGSNPEGADDARQDLAQSSTARSQQKEAKSPLNIWLDRRSDRLARFFPSLNRRSNAAETSHSVASQRSDNTPSSTSDVGLHASRPVTRFRDLPPEPEEGQNTAEVGLPAIAAANAPASNEGEVLRASLPPRERSASTFTQGMIEPQSPVFQTGSGESKGSALVANSEPAAPALIAMNLSAEPENLLPPSLRRDQDEPADSPLALAPIQDQAPSSKPSSEKTQEKKSSSASPPAEKPKSKSATPPQPAPRRKSATPAQSRQEPSAEPKKSTAATKPAADEMKLQSPELEPAIQPPSPRREPRPEPPKDVSSHPSPPPVPSAVRETPAPSTPAPPAAAAPPAAVVSPPGAAAAPPSAAIAPPPAGVAPQSAPGVVPQSASGAAPAGYALSPPAATSVGGSPDLARL